MRNVADAVTVQIVAAVFIPVVPGEHTGRSPAVGGYVERIAGKSIGGETAIERASLHLDRPAVSRESVPCRLDSIRAIGNQPCRVVFEDVPLEPAVRDLLEQQPV